ncbi:DUF416 family protein [Chitinophaga filiformis]|uniref:DUF416 family protein n=1 Tax=Chitinophaga filiformis TaxID=104663 RepID=UPI001F18FEA7|nr:DUF416 family protein [Chitinophaga filiformis]MCF6402947.1 DUF416 family protein [Chitinophaga filiformis]
MLENLEEALSALDEKDISRLALTNAETLWITFRDVYRKEYRGNAAQIDKSLDEAWSVSNTGNITDTERLELAVKEEIPDMDDYSDIFETEWRSALASAAQNAVISVWQAISSLHSGAISKAMETATITDNTIDLLINTRQSIDKGDDFDYDDEYVQQHQLMQEELKRQSDAIAAIKSGETELRAKFVHPLRLDRL